MAPKENKKHSLGWGWREKYRPINKSGGASGIEAENISSGYYKLVLAQEKLVGDFC